MQRNLVVLEASAGSKQGSCLHRRQTGGSSPTEAARGLHKAQIYVQVGKFEYHLVSLLAEASYRICQAAVCNRGGLLEALAALLHQNFKLVNYFASLASECRRMLSSIVVQQQGLRSVQAAQASLDH